ncbi:MAG: hypothetical protein ACR2PY_07915 [Salinispira sp.]
MLWNRLENAGVTVKLLDRGDLYRPEQGVDELSWKHSCSKSMREWAENVGVFVPLDDFYDQITFLEPSKPGGTLAQPRDSRAIDLSTRVLV